MRGTGALALAHDLLVEYGGPHGLARALPAELARRPGVGPAKAARLVAGVRARPPAGHEGRPALSSTTRPTSPSWSARGWPTRGASGSCWSSATTALRVRRAFVLTEGSSDECLLPVRELLTAVLQHDGAGFAVAHNHPSGDVTPSDADGRSPPRCADAADAVGLDFLGHVVVGGERWASCVPRRRVLRRLTHHEPTAGRARPDAASRAAAAWAMRALAAALDGSGPALARCRYRPAPGARRAAGGLPTRRRGRARWSSTDVALVVPTSGSTGEPKGALLTAAALRASAAATHARLAGPGAGCSRCRSTHVAGLMVRRPLPGRPGRSPSRWQLDGRLSTRIAFASATASRGGAARSDGTPLYASLVPTQLTGCSTRVSTCGLRRACCSARPRHRRGSLARAGRGRRARGDHLRDERDLRRLRLRRRARSTGCRGSASIADGRVLLGGPTLFAGYRLRPDLTAAALDPHGRLVTSDLGAPRDDGRLRIARAGRRRHHQRWRERRACTGRGRARRGDRGCAPARSSACRRRLGRTGRRAGRRGSRTRRSRASPSSAPSSAAGSAPAALPPRPGTLDAIPLLATGKPDRSTLRRLAAGDYAGPPPTDAKES